VLSPGAVAFTTVDPAGSASTAQPSCTLTVQSALVTLPRLVALRKNAKKKKSGIVTLKATCDQAVTGSLTGAATITAAKKGKKKPRPKTVALKPVNLTAAAGKSVTVSIKLPKTVLTALKGKSRVGATFSLTAGNGNGVTTVTVVIARLKGVKRRR
jgi:hypothetical protein